MWHWKLQLLGCFILLTWSAAGWCYSSEMLAADYNIEINHEDKTVQLPKGATVSDSFDPPRILIHRTGSGYTHLSASSANGQFFINVDGQLYVIVNPEITSQAQAAIHTPPAQRSPLLSLPVPLLEMQLVGYIPNFMQTNQHLYAQAQSAANQQQLIESLTRELEFPPLPSRPAPSDRERELQDELAKIREEHRIALEKEREKVSKAIAKEKASLTAQYEDELRSHKEEIDKLERQAEILSKPNPVDSKELQRNLNRERQNSRTLRQQLRETERQLREEKERVQRLQDEALTDATQFHEIEQSQNERLANLKRDNERLRKNLATAERAYAPLMFRLEPPTAPEQQNTEPTSPAISKDESASVSKPPTPTSEKSTDSTKISKKQNKVAIKENEQERLKPAKGPSADKLERRDYEKQKEALLKELGQAINKIKTSQLRQRQAPQVRLHKEASLDDYWQQIQKLNERTRSQADILPLVRAYSRVLLDQLERHGVRLSVDDGLPASVISKTYQRLLKLIAAYPPLFAEVSILDSLKNPFTLNLDDVDPLLAPLKLAIADEWTSIAGVFWRYIATQATASMTPTILASHLEILNLALLAEDFQLTSTVAQRLPDVEEYEATVIASFFGADEATANQPLARRLYRQNILLERIMLKMLPGITSGQLWKAFTFTQVQALILRLHSLLVVMANQYDDFSVADLDSENNDSSQLLVKQPDVLDNEAKHWVKHIQTLERREKVLSGLAAVTKEKEPDPDQKLLHAFDLFLRESAEPPSPPSPPSKVAEACLLDPLRRFAALGLTPQFTPGDGHCFFHAIIQSIGDQQPAQDFIQQLIQFAQQQSEYTTIFTQIAEQQQDASFDLNQIVSQLLNAQSLTSPGQQQNWGGQEILSLVSYFLEQSILVIEANHHFSGSGHIAILFQPGSDPLFLNFLEIQAHLIPSDPNLIILGFLQGDQARGYGNHWFPLSLNSVSGATVHTEEGLPLPTAPTTTSANSSSLPNLPAPEDVVIQHVLQFLHFKN